MITSIISHLFIMHNKCHIGASKDVHDSAVI
jgi:hypothetical protein